MKQTAVEWLYETLWKQNDYSLPSNILEQFKEREKQQIMDAYLDSTSQFSVDSRIDYPKTAEQYYTQTYKKQNHE